MTAYNSYDAALPDPQANPLSGPLSNNAHRTLPEQVSDGLIGLVGQTFRKPIDIRHLRQKVWQVSKFLGNVYGILTQFITKL